MAGFVHAVHGGRVRVGIEEVLRRSAEVVQQLAVFRRPAFNLRHQPVAGGQPSVIARFQTDGNVHPVAVRHHSVRQRHADEAPFLAQNFVAKSAVRTCPARADTVEGGHGGVRTALFHRVLETLQVDFTNRLFRREGCNRLAVRLKVIEREVLDVDDQPLRASRCHFLRRHLAGQEAVLGVILEVTAGVRRAVDVHRRAVPANHAVVGAQRIFAHRQTDIVEDFRVERRRHDRFGGIRHRGVVAGIRRLDALRAVRCHRRGQTDGVDCPRAVAGVANQFRQIRQRQLIEQIHPHRVVVVLANQVRQGVVRLG